MEYNFTMRQPILMVVSCLLVACSLTSISAAAPEIEKERGTCLILAWHGKDFAFGADSLAGVNTYLFPYKSTVCKLKLAGPVLIAASGLVKFGQWDAEETAASLVDKMPDSQNFVAIAQEWQRLAMQQFNSKPPQKDQTPALVELSLVIRKPSGDPELVRAAISWDGHEAFAEKPEVQNPPATGQTGVMLSGVCKQWWKMKENFLTPVEQERLIYLANEKKQQAHELNGLIELVSLQEQFFSMVDQNHKYGLVGGPFDYAVLKTNSKVWEALPGSGPCSK